VLCCPAQKLIQFVVQEAAIARWWWLVLLPQHQRVPSCTSGLWSLADTVDNVVTAGVSFGMHACRFRCVVPHHLAARVGQGLHALGEHQGAAGYVCVERLKAYSVSDVLRLSVQAGAISTGWGVTSACQLVKPASTASDTHGRGFLCVVAHCFAATRGFCMH
jgi:hypothetical protein